MQIVILDGYAVNPGDLSWEGFKRFGTLSVYDRTPEAFIAQRMLGADAVITNKTPIRAEHLTKAANLKYIGVLGTGCDNVDVAAAAARGIAVANAPGYSSNAVAQLVFALLLEICHNVALHSREVHKGRWTHCPDYCFWDTPLIELAGRTMGIVGCGNIGSRVAEIARAFGMRVLGTSRVPHPEFPGEQVSLDELLARADVVSLHCPATDETRGLICEDTIARMKDGAILINTARGAVVDAQALADALNAGKLYAAGVDVADKEPIARSNPLLEAKNCFITPHIGWAPLDARKRLVELSVDNLRAFLAGEAVNRVDR